MAGTKVTTIPYIRQVIYTTYAAFPTTGLKEGDLGYATDTLLLYRWSGAAWQSITELGGGKVVYGDGSDGDVTIAANTTLTRDMFYNNLTINAGFYLYNDSYRIFVKETVTINQNINNNGYSAAGSVAGVARPPHTLGGSTAGATGVGGESGGGGGGGGILFLAAKNIINNGAIYATGGNGGNASGGTADTNGANSTQNAKSAGGTGGNGGAVGANAGGIAGAAAVTLAMPRSLPNALAWATEATAGLIQGGTGGGSGARNSGGNGGGGGGGGGGCVIIIYNTATWGTETANGGTGGNGIGTGAAGVVGSAGRVIKICNQ